MSQDTQQVDAVLLSFRKRRSTPACYPCSKRKVRCRGGRPCDACKARGHPDICQDEDSRKQKRQKTPATNGNRATVSTQAYEPHQQNGHFLPSPASPSRISVPPQPSGQSPYAEPTVGRFSAINFVCERLSKAHNTIDPDLHPSIGLGNTDNRFLTVAPLNVGPPESLTPPTRDEVMKYYPPFRNNIVVLYSFVHDIAALDSELYNIVRDDSQVSSQYIAVALASLALGAQFTEVVGQPRREISRNFISRSTAYLQKANYVFQPTMEVVQALLMIGMALQNCGQSDGAWVLLGLNYRLAQTLGLHLLDPKDGQGAMLWTALIWQDASISLRYDRPPLSYGMGIKDLDRGSDLSYYQAVRSFCLLAIDMLQRPSEQRTDMQYVLHSVNTLDDVVARCCEHLQPKDLLRSLEQRLQRYALVFHHSLVLAEVCRPVFSISGPRTDSSINALRQRGLDALNANIEAYLEICAFSNVPLRLWSMTQGAVSCALVLALIDGQNRLSSIQPLLCRLMSALKMDTGSEDPTTNLPVELLQGVCLMRVKAAGLLESIIADTQASIDASRDETPDSSFGRPIDPLDMTWPTDLSLFDQAFADSVLDFDLDKGIYANASS